MLHLVDILRLQKVDRETFNFSMPYFYFSASPGIAFVIIKEKHAKSVNTKMVQSAYIIMIHDTSYLLEEMQEGKC